MAEQFIYLLRLTERYHDPKAWTDSDNQVLDAHFTRLAKATEAGSVILAGRTAEPLDQTFGLVIFDAENIDAARQFMQTDPTVAAGIMTASLHPYTVALQRKP